jgi:hypothetical protein
MRNPVHPENNGGSTRRLSLALLILAYAGLFLVIFGAKLIIISQYTMPHPYRDSWHVEGLETYKTYLSGHYTVAALFAPASEHRPAILRLYGLALLILNGQWDVQLQMVGTAILFGIFGCLFLAFARGNLPLLYSFVLASGTGLVLSLPVGWENTVNGHHAGWFFFCISTALTLWLCAGDQPLKKGWWLGFAMAGVAYFSLFAGVITPLAASVGMLFRYALDRNNVRRVFLGIFALLVLFALGIVWENRFSGQ